MTWEESVITAGVWAFAMLVIKKVLAEAWRQDRVAREAVTRRKALAKEQLQRDLTRTHDEEEYFDRGKVAILRSDRSRDRRRWEFRFQEAQGAKLWAKRAETLRAWAGDQAEEQQP